MNFRSDNVAGISTEVIRAISRANQGSAASYGGDATTADLTDKFSQLFEHEVAVFAVATGTAANALSLASLVPSFGAVLCHERAHINEEECGAPEFYTGGAKLIPLQGANGKLSTSTLESAVAKFRVASIHSAVLTTLSLSQPTELGTCYKTDELRALSDIARASGLTIHMDGARFANAVVSLGRTPAELTWKVGVDVLSLGFTKNGALAAECVIFFDTARAREFEFRRKRGGHLWSKTRFLASQIAALLEYSLWLQLAGHANAMAARLAAGLRRLPQFELLYPVEANLLFVRLPSAQVLGVLRNLGVDPAILNCGPDPPMVRFACSFETTPDDVDSLIDICSRA